MAIVYIQSWSHKAIVSFSACLTTAVTTEMSQHILQDGVWIGNKDIYILYWRIVLHFQGGDDIHHVRTYAEIVTVPDPEILMVSIITCFINNKGRSSQMRPFSQIAS